MMILISTNVDMICLNLIHLSFYCFIESMTYVPFLAESPIFWKSFFFNEAISVSLKNFENFFNSHAAWIMPIFIGMCCHFRPLFFSFHNSNKRIPSSFPLRYICYHPYMPPKSQTHECYWLHQHSRPSRRFVTAELYRRNFSLWFSRDECIISLMEPWHRYWRCRRVL